MNKTLATTIGALAATIALTGTAHAGGAGWGGVTVNHDDAEPKRAGYRTCNIAITNTSDHTRKVHLRTTYRPGTNRQRSVGQTFTLAPGATVDRNPTIRVDRSRRYVVVLLDSGALESFTLSGDKPC